MSVKKEVVPVIIEGLRRLEYRGYDSAGIAVAGNGDRPAVRRAEGKLRNLEEVIRLQAARRHLRHRPHPLGHARPSHRRKRPSASRLHRQDRGRAQRHRRKLSHPKEEADRGRPQVHHRDRHRSHRSPDRKASTLKRQRPPVHSGGGGSADSKRTQWSFCSGGDLRPTSPTKLLLLATVPRR